MLVLHRLTSTVRLLMINMKVAFDQESRKWRVLEKLCISIGNLRWCIKKEGFATKQEAQQYIDEEIKE